MPLPRPVSLHDAFDAIDDHWSPRIAAELNRQHVRIAKLLGEFVWHAHEHEDELFLVHRGTLVIEFRENGVERPSVTLGPGELLVIPRGVEHRPVAESECEVILFEPADTVNTGAHESERTRRDLPRA